QQPRGTARRADAAGRPRLGPAADVAPPDAGGAAPRPRGGLPGDARSAARRVGRPLVARPPRRPARPRPARRGGPVPPGPPAPPALGRGLEGVPRARVRRFLVG